MSNFTLGYNDLSIDATYSGGTYQNGHDTDMLKNEYISGTIRTTDLTDLQIDVTLSSSQENKIAGLINHNLTSSGTWRVRVYSDSGRTNNLYDSGTLNIDSYNEALNHKTCCHVFDDTYNDVYYRFNFSDATNPDGYFKIGNFFIGRKFSNDAIGDNQDYGYTHELIDDSIVLSSLTGVESSIRYQIKRRLILSMSYKDDILANDYLVMGLNSGITQRVLFELDPDDFNEGIGTMVARLDKANALQSVSYNLNNLNLSIREMI